MTDPPSSPCALFYWFGVECTERRPHHPHRWCESCVAGAVVGAAAYADDGVRHCRAGGPVTPGIDPR